MIAALQIRTVAAASLAMALFSSCENKELCLDHGEHTLRYASRVNATYDLIWEQPEDNGIDWPTEWPSLNLAFGYDALRPAVPEGIRMIAYNGNGTRTETNMPAYGAETYLPAGNNSVLFYNNDTEYIVFDNLSSYGDATATTRSRYRSSYTGNPLYASGRSSGTKSDETTVSAPDVLFGHYVDSYVQGRDTQAQQFDITMRPLVFTYVIRYIIEEGYENVALARGAVAGMARAVYLHNGHTSPEAVTVLYDCTLEPWGIQAVVKSFGIPDYPNPSYSRRPGDFAITLEVRLKNGYVASQHFDITAQMERQPHGGVITVDGIEIKNDSGSADGGFDVSVDDWGEFEDVPVEM